VSATEPFDSDHGHLRLTVNIPADLLITRRASKVVVTLKQLNTSIISNCAQGSFPLEVEYFSRPVFLKHCESYLLQTAVKFATIS